MNQLLQLMALNGSEPVFGALADLTGDPGDGETFVRGADVLEAAGMRLPEEFFGPEPVERSFLSVETEERWRSNLGRVQGAAVSSEDLAPWETWSVGVPIDNGLVVHVPDDKARSEGPILFAAMGETEGRLRLVLDGDYVVASRFEASLHCQHRQCETEQHCADPCGSCHCTLVKELVGDVLLEGTACRCSGH